MGVLLPRYPVPRPSYQVLNLNTPATQDTVAMVKDCSLAGCDPPLRLFKINTDGPIIESCDQRRHFMVSVTNATSRFEGLFGRINQPVDINNATTRSGEMFFFTNDDLAVLRHRYRPRREVEARRARGLGADRSCSDRSPGVCPSTLPPT